MKKNFKKALLLIIFPFLLVGCVKKPSLNLHTKNLIKTLRKSNNFEISIFYPKTGRNKSIPPSYIERFNEFLSSLKDDYFIKEDINTKNPEFRLTVFENDKEKFIINILNDNYITVHPWDGFFKEDIINISKLPDGVNLYNIIDYVIKHNV